MTPTYGKSWAKTLLMSDLTLGSSFKVKPWLFGFGEFSFWWIQFASVLLCARSSCNCNVFMLSTIYPCTTGLKVLCYPSDCTITAQLLIYRPFQN